MVATTSISWDDIPDEHGERGDPQPHVLIWLDPGKLTGYALWYPERQRFGSGELGVMPLGEFLEVLVTECGPMAWVGYEDYTIRPGTGVLDSAGMALEVTGITHWLTHRHHARLLKPQQPADRSFGEKHLRAIGWHKPTPGGHADVAAAHLLSFLAGYFLVPGELLKRITWAYDEQLPPG
jgi:hypothetical protein